MSHAITNASFKIKVIFQIVFRAVESQPGFGFIFLDNITITNGFCGTYMQLRIYHKNAENFFVIVHVRINMFRIRNRNNDLASFINYMKSIVLIFFWSL